MIICVLLGVLYIFVVIFPVFFVFAFSVLAKRLAGKSVSKMTYFMSSRMLDLNSVNQCIITGISEMLLSLVRMVSCGCGRGVFRRRGNEWRASPVFHVSILRSVWTDKHRLT